MVTVTLKVMGCPCLLKTDTRFPLHTNDRIEFKSEQDVNRELMKLADLRAEDEIKIQQRANAIQWTMADVPPRVASRDALSPAQAFQCPAPESIRQWGE
jgi:hypothetical protein